MKPLQTHRDYSEMDRISVQSFMGLFQHSRASASSWKSCTLRLVSDKLTVLKTSIRYILLVRQICSCSLQVRILVQLAGKEVH